MEEQFASFLAQIEQSPSNLENRLVLADYLDEQGDQRGELVRLETDLLQISQLFAKNLKPLDYTLPPSLSQLELRSPRIADAMNDLMCKVYQLAGDGRKTAVLICATLLGNLVAGLYRQELVGPEIHDNLDDWQNQIAGLVLGLAQPPNYHSLVNVANTVTHGHQQLADCLVEGLRVVGPAGCITVVSQTDQPNDQVNFVLEDGMRFPLKTPDCIHGKSLKDCLFVFCKETPVPAMLLPLLNRLVPSNNYVCFYPSEKPIDWLEDLATKGLVTIRYSPESRATQLLKDLAKATGGRMMLNSEASLTLEQAMGRAAICSFDDQSLTIFDADGTLDEPYLVAIENEIEQATDEILKKWHSERLARLFGRNGYIHVPANQVEPLHELACSALYSLLAFVESGGVPGGGASYFYCANRMAFSHSKDPSREQLQNSLQTPLRVLMKNAGLDFDTFFKSQTDNLGCFNATVGSAPVPYEELSSIDPAKVVAIVLTEALQTTRQLLQELTL